MALSIREIQEYDHASPGMRALMDLAWAYDEAKRAEQALAEYPRYHLRLKKAIDEAWERAEEAYEHWVIVR